MSKQTLRTRIKKMSTVRKLLLGLAALLLLTGALAGGVYLYFTIPDARVYRELDEDFGRDFFEIFLLDLETFPDLLPSEPGEEDEGETRPDTSGDPEENNTAPADNAPGSNGAPPDSTDSPQNGSTSDRRSGSTERSSSTAPETARRSKEEIVNTYTRKIRTLEAIALERLDQLKAAAKAEYREQQAAGQVDEAQLARKYIQAGERLEKNVDQKFQEILGEMERLLRDNQHPTGIIAEIKKAYQQEKTNMRKHYYNLNW